MPEPSQKDCSISCTYRGASWQVALTTLGLAFALGCATPTVGTNYDIQVTNEGAYQLTETAVLLSKRRHTETPIAAHKHHFYQPGRALPKGTLVKVFPPSSPRVANAPANLKLAPPANPWFLVQVIDGLEAHKGWEGWVHVSSLRHADPGTTFPERKEVLRESNVLCKDAKFQECSMPVHPSLLHRIVSCEGGGPLVEVWDPNGNYIAGYIAHDSFIMPPCPGE